MKSKVNENKGQKEGFIDKNIIQTYLKILWSKKNIILLILILMLMLLTTIDVNIRKDAYEKKPSTVYVLDEDKSDMSEYVKYILETISEVVEVKDRNSIYAGIIYQEASAGVVIPPGFQNHIYNPSQQEEYALPLNFLAFNEYDANSKNIENRLTNALSKDIIYLQEYKKDIFNEIKKDKKLEEEYKKGEDDTKEYQITKKLDKPSDVRLSDEQSKEFVKISKEKFEKDTGKDITYEMLKTGEMSYDKANAMVGYIKIIIFTLTVLVFCITIYVENSLRKNSFNNKNVIRVLDQQKINLNIALIGLLFSILLGIFMYLVLGIYFSEQVFSIKGLTILITFILISLFTFEFSRISNKIFKNKKTTKIVGSIILFVFLFFADIFMPTYLLGWPKWIYNIISKTPIASITKGLDAYIATANAGIAKEAYIYGLTIFIIYILTLFAIDSLIDIIKFNSKAYTKYILDDEELEYINNFEKHKIKEKEARDKKKLKNEKSTNKNKNGNTKKTKKTSSNVNKNTNKGTNKGKKNNKRKNKKKQEKKIKNKLKN